MDQQTDQQPAVKWGPENRTGKILDEFPLHGETWCVVASDEWQERADLRDADRRYYQRERTSFTVPCLLTIRKTDLQPAAPVAPKRGPSVGVREDVAAALKMAQDLHDLTTGAQRHTAAALERVLRGIQAQVEQG